MTDVTSSDVRCYDSTESGTAQTLSVAAGDTIGFTVYGNPSNLYHPGVCPSPTLLQCQWYKGIFDHISDRWSMFIWLKLQVVPMLLTGLVMVTCGSR